MKTLKSILPRAALFLLIFTIICGLLYTAIISGIAQLVFPNKANGSIIEINGTKYGSSLLGQQYTDESHMWGRIMKLDISTFKDKDGTPLLYAQPSNLSPASDEYETLVAKRVEMLKKANPAMDETAIPVDLVTCSGSGLDPHISIAAAEYQVSRLALANNKSEEEIRAIINDCTDGKFLNLFGEETVNVLEVNLTLDGIM